MKFNKNIKVGDLCLIVDRDYDPNADPDWRSLWYVYVFLGRQGSDKHYCFLNIEDNIFKVRRVLDRFYWKFVKLPLQSKE